MQIMEDIRNYSAARAACIEEYRRRRMMESSVLPRFPTLSPAARIPYIFDYDYDRAAWPIATAQAEPRIAVPALEVPEAPVEPEPAAESASIQMLRQIVTDRQAELKRVEDERAEDVAEIAHLETSLAEYRADVEQHDRHIAAANASIEATLVDIAKLGGAV